MIVVPPKPCMLRRIVIKNRGIIIIRVWTWKIWSPLLSWPSRWALSNHTLPLDHHYKAIYFDVVES